VRILTFLNASPAVVYNSLASLVYFTYLLFNDAFNSSDYTASNKRQISDN
jgi:hypothetical protein